MWSTMRSLILRRRFYCSHLWRRRQTQNAGVLRWRRHCSHTSGLRRRKSRREPQNSPQIALHCSHSTPRGKSRRKTRTANRFIVAVALAINKVNFSEWSGFICHSAFLHLRFYMSKFYIWIMDLFGIYVWNIDFKVEIILCKSRIRNIKCKPFDSSTHYESFPTNEHSSI